MHEKSGNRGMCGRGGLQAGRQKMSRLDCVLEQLLKGCSRLFHIQYQSPVVCCCIQ